MRSAAGERKPTRGGAGPVRVPHLLRGCATPPAFERKENNLDGLKVFLPETHGQNLALTVLYVPYLLESGPVFVKLGLAEDSGRS